jgi:hypothetical protein
MSQVDFAAMALDEAKRYFLARRNNHSTSRSPYRTADLLLLGQTFGV